jgi:hypothetical protein
MPFRIIPASVKGRIANLLREGKTTAEVARICDVSTASVLKIARVENIDYVRTAPGAHWGKRGTETPKQLTVVDEAAEWRAKAWASRRFCGSGYVT